MSKLYSLEFMHYFKNQLHKVKDVSDYSFRGKSNNLSCGDSIEFGVDFNKDTQQFKKIGYDGVGCIVSLAAAELLSDKFTDANINLVKKYSEEDYFRDLGFKLTPSRQKCALISFRALKNAVDKIT